LGHDLLLSIGDIAPIGCAAFSSLVNQTKETSMTNQIDHEDLNLALQLIANSRRAYLELDRHQVLRQRHTGRNNVTMSESEICFPPDQARPHHAAIRRA
jgi:hypothetical protein